MVKKIIEEGFNIPLTSKDFSTSNFLQDCGVTPSDEALLAYYVGIIYLKAHGGFTEIFGRFPSSEEDKEIKDLIKDKVSEVRDQLPR